jgi:hypothetical protein
MDFALNYTVSILALCGTSRTRLVNSAVRVIKALKKRADVHID